MSWCEELERESYLNKRKYHCDGCKHSRHFVKNWECLRGVYLQDCYEKENILRVFVRIWWFVKNYINRRV